MVVRCHLRRDLFDAETMERMMRHFERLLEAVVRDPEAKIGRLPLLSERGTGRGAGGVE